MSDKSHYVKELRAKIKIAEENVRIKQKQFNDMSSELNIHDYTRALGEVNACHVSLSTLKEKLDRAMGKYKYKDND